METQYSLHGEDLLCGKLFMTVIVTCVRKVKCYNPVVRIAVFGCLVCCVLPGACRCVFLFFAAVVSKLEKKQKFSKCRETLIFLL